MFQEPRASGYELNAGWPGARLRKFRLELILSTDYVVVSFSILVQAATLRVVVESTLPFSAGDTIAKPPA